MLPLAIFRSSAVVVKQNRSFIKMLKSSGPRTDSFGTPGSEVWNVLWKLLMFKTCFRRFRYEYKKMKSSLKLQASIFVLTL